VRSRRLIEELEGVPPPPERTFWQLLPRRNLRRALLLLIAIVAVLAIKRTGGLSLDKIFERVAPAVPMQPAGSGAGFQHIEVHPPARDPHKK
jgi:hypothetical protein